MALYLAFASDADNLVAQDTNGATDVFRRNLSSGTTTLLSVDSNGSQGTGNSWEPAISSSGRYVAFTSDNPFDTTDTNNEMDIYLRDTQAGTTTLMSVDSSGTPGNAASWAPAISANGRYIAFLSDADNLTTGISNGCTNVFVHDRTTGATTRVNLGDNGVEPNANCTEVKISADASTILFTTAASNMLANATAQCNNVYAIAWQNNLATPICISMNTSGVYGDADSWCPAVSSNGRYLVSPLLRR